jgi:hypothetical protein
MKRIIQVFVALLIMFSMAACSSKANPKVGDTYQGGVAFYILQAGDIGYNANVVHGLIASTEDQHTNIKWGLLDYRYVAAPGGTFTAIGTGSVNTDSIITQNGAGITYASGIARAYEGGGYTDWYLPSQDELHLLFLSQDIVGGFSNKGYWSSSEAIGEPSKDNVWIQGFALDYTYDGMKSNYNSGRAIRSF